MILLVCCALVVGYLLGARSKIRKDNATQYDARVLINVIRAANQRADQWYRVATCRNSWDGQRCDLSTVDALVGTTVEER